MGSVNKYDKKEIVYVRTTTFTALDNQGNPVPSTPVLYGFPTNVDQSQRATLGQTTILESEYANPPQGLMVGCTWPKPARASKKIGSGTAAEIASSFCSSDLITGLIQAGWRVTTPTKPSPLITAAEATQRGLLVNSVYINFRGVKYGWQMPTETITRVSPLFSGLGIVAAQESDTKEVVFGCNFPIPPRAKGTTQTAPAGGAQGPATINMHSTYYDPAKDISTIVGNWTHFQNAVVKITNKGFRRKK